MTRTELGTGTRPGPAGSTRRQRQREATLREIIEVSRALVADPAGLSLRSVAQQMGITAPALYRYVESYQALVLLVADDIDRENAGRIAAARDRQPDDDPAGQIICAAIAFRQWALSHRAEFALVFTNPVTAHEVTADEMRKEQTGLVFTELLFRIWQTYDFPLPALDELDPGVLEALQDPAIPVHPDRIPSDAPGLTWVFMQSWAALYGTVTLEVFGHCDPRIIATGALFRSMLAAQSQMLGIDHELERLQPLIAHELARSL